MEQQVQSPEYTTAYKLEGFDPATMPEGHIPFVQESFTPESIGVIKTLTNPNGQGNAAFENDKELKMLPQDALVRMWGWFHGKTGLSIMFKWASGRQDAFVIPDIPEALETSPEVQAHKQRLETFKPAIDALKN